MLCLLEYVFTFTVTLHKSVYCEGHGQVAQVFIAKGSGLRDPTCTKTHSHLLIQNVKENRRWEIMSVLGMQGHDNVERM